MNKNNKHICISIKYLQWNLAFFNFVCVISFKLFKKNKYCKLKKTINIFYMWIVVCSDWFSCTYLW